MSSQQLEWLSLLVLTMGVYLFSVFIQKLLKGLPIVHPIVLSVIILGVIIRLLDIDYQRYFQANQLIHLLLGPATVAMAVPLYYQLSTIKKVLFPLLFTIVIGALTACVIGVLVASWLGVDQLVVLSMAPKSITAPVALGVSEKLGGVASVTVSLVVLTGMMGLILGPLLFKLFGVTDERRRGLIMGVISHGMGVAYSYQRSRAKGVFAGLGMILAAVVTAILLPILAIWLF